MDTRKLTEKLWHTMDSQNWNALEELVAPDIKLRVGGRPLNKAEWKGMGELFYGAFPDGKHVIETVIVEGDRASVTARFEGTHQAPFMGIPATGKKITLTSIMVDRFDAKGRLCEHTGEFDSASLMHQLGVSK